MSDTLAPPTSADLARLVADAAAAATLAQVRKAQEKRS